MFKAILLACLVGYASCCTPSFFEMLAEIWTTGTCGDCRCGKANKIQKIVGGQTTEENEYPWQVGISGEGSDPFCGGSLISNKHVLTAAHCAQSSGDYYVLLGDHSLSDSEEKRVKVCNIKNHPAYDDDTFDYDFSVLTLCEEVEFNDKISPVCLPKIEGQVTQYEGKDAIVSGWGTLSNDGIRPDKLQDVTVKTMSNYDCCRESYYFCSQITDSMICASNPGSDSCQGDSGGPMVTADSNGIYTLIGVVSWGFGCVEPPGVYARVTNQLSWITDGVDYCSA